MSWLRNNPESPDKLTGSLWFWFWQDGAKEPIVMEIWPGRKFGKNTKGWWFTIPVSRPTEKIPGTKGEKENKHRPIIIEK